jgi:hypothetical protein
MVDPEPVVGAPCAKWARLRRRFRRSILLAGGGAAAVVLGVALSTAGAHPAAASPLAVPALPLAPSVPGAVKSIIGSGAVLPQIVGHAVAPVLHAGMAPITPVVALTGTVRNVVLAPSVPAAAPAAAHSLATVARPVLVVGRPGRTAGTPAATVHARPLSVAASVAASTPVAPPLRRTHPVPLPLPPVPAPAGTTLNLGSGPLGMLPQGSLLLATPTVVGVAVAVSATPRLLFDTRSAPPG